jgi:uncharacterized protein
LFLGSERDGGLRLTHLRTLCSRLCHPVSSWRALCDGNDWARGFNQGTRLRHDGRAELLADDDHGGCMIPMLTLYHEHDEAPAICPKLIGAEQRKKIIESMAARLVAAHRYFRQHGKPNASTRGPNPPYTSSPSLQY